MQNISIPRIVIAGLAGDSGKTIFSCGLLACLKSSKMLSVAPFKKGPDYIDAAWLQVASGETTRNLDLFMMSKETILRSFKTRSDGKDFALIEGNRGLYDGMDAKGSHSTAELAKLLKAPVIIVVNPNKVTRTVAAFILGCKMLDNEVNIAGIVINKATPRQYKVIKEAVEDATGIKVLACMPDYKGINPLPARHLGLVTPSEHDSANKAIAAAMEIVESSVDIDGIIEIARSAPTIPFDNGIVLNAKAEIVKIGYFSDKAFSFYYPENLEMLEKYGAKLVSISAISDRILPDIDALYIGGGFPETNIESLSSNFEMMNQVRSKVENGLPIYAECGGLMYLCKELAMEGKSFRLAGVFDARIEMDSKPQGHGYATAFIDKPNPYYEVGTKIKGHEFHYSKITAMDKTIQTCMKMEKGAGSLDKRDGLLYKNVFATYVHTHALSLPQWATVFVQNALNYQKIKNQ